MSIDIWFDEIANKLVNLRKCERLLQINCFKIINSSLSSVSMREYYSLNRWNHSLNCGLSAFQYAHQSLGSKVSLVFDICNGYTENKFNNDKFESAMLIFEHTR